MSPPHNVGARGPKRGKYMKNGEVTWQNSVEELTLSPSHLVHAPSILNKPHILYLEFLIFRIIYTGLRYSSSLSPRYKIWFKPKTLISLKILTCRSFIASKIFFRRSVRSITISLISSFLIPSISSLCRFWIIFITKLCAFGLFFKLKYYYYF